MLIGAKIHWKKSYEICHWLPDVCKVPETFYEQYLLITAANAHPLW